MGIPNVYSLVVYLPDDDIPNIWKKKVPNHQPVYLATDAKRAIKTAAFDCQD